KKDLYLLLNQPMPKFISQGANMTFEGPNGPESFLVLCPQLDKQYNSWENFYIDEMIDYAKRSLHVDTNRVYLTGMSMGGGGVWKYANSSFQNARKLAAIAPVCGTIEWNRATLVNTIDAAGVAVWVFHARNDRWNSVDSVS